MTISSTNRIAGPAIGNGVTDTIPFTFKVFSVLDIVVVHQDMDTFDVSYYIKDTHYSVHLNSDQNSNPGGYIVIIEPETYWMSGTAITITSSVLALQNADITSRGGFYAGVINDALDKLTVLIQQQDNSVSRSLKFPIVDDDYIAELPSRLELANRVLSFDESGYPVAGPTIENMQSVIDTILSVLSLGAASGISYSYATSGLPASNVQTAIDAVDGIVDTVSGKVTSLTTLTGVSSGSTVLGAFSGGGIQSNATIKVAFQEVLNSLYTKKQFITSVVTVYVGDDQQFVNVGDALEWASQLSSTYKSAAFLSQPKINITLKSGYVWKYSTLLKDVDLSHVTIVDEDASTNISALTFTETYGEFSNKYVIALDNSKGPTIGVKINLGGIGMSGFYVGNNSSISFMPGAGATGGSYGVFVDSCSSVSARDANFSGNSYGVYVYGSGEVDVRGAVIDACGTAGILADGASLVSASGADVSGGAGYGIYCKSSANIDFEGGDAADCGTGGILCAGGKVNAKSASCRMSPGVDGSSDIVCTLGGIISAPSAVGGTTPASKNTASSAGIIFG